MIGPIVLLKRERKNHAEKKPIITSGCIQKGEKKGCTMETVELNRGKSSLPSATF